jgi:hypothetical protein
MDYCQGAKLDEECPCPALKRMGCCPDVGCPEPKELALAPLVRLVLPRLVLLVPQRQALQEPEKLEREPLELPPLVRLVPLGSRLP